MCTDGRTDGWMDKQKPNVHFTPSSPLFEKVVGGRGSLLQHAAAAAAVYETSKKTVNC